MEMTNLLPGSSLPGNIHGTHWVRPTTSLDIMTNRRYATSLFILIYNSELYKQRHKAQYCLRTKYSVDKTSNRALRESEDLLQRSQEPDTAPYGKAACP